MTAPVPFSAFAAVGHPGHSDAMRPVRARGRVAVTFAVRSDATYAARVEETGGYRIRFPRPARARSSDAVIINTGGGMAAGDNLSLYFTAGARAAATVTTQSAERIYRSDGAETSIDCVVKLAPESRLFWLPQEAILFDHARLARRIDVTMAGDATLLMAEMVVFGRTAMGETLSKIFFSDRWRIRRDGELILAEAVRVDGNGDDMLKRRAIGGGARAVATVVLSSPEAESLIDGARAVIEHDVGAVSAWNGLLCARFLAADAVAVRRAVARFVAWASGGPVPRVWGN